MTIAQNQLIQALDFNGIRNVISSILSSDSGYGQSLTSALVNQNNTVDTITAQPSTTQWIYLYADMKKVADHQGTSIIALTNSFNENVGPGKLIKAQDIKLFSDTAILLYNNRFNLGAGVYSDEALTSSERTTYWGKGAKTFVQHSFDVTFTTELAARNFFNAGGQIRFSAGRSGGTAPVNATNPTSNNLDWSTMLDKMGVIIFDNASTRGTGLVPGSGGAGFYNGANYGLSTTPAQIFTKGGNAESGGSSYANNDYTIMGSLTTGSPFVLHFDIYFRNDGKSPQINAWGDYDYVDGTLVSTVLTRRATVGVVVQRPSAVNSVLLSDGVVLTYNITPNYTTRNEGSTVIYTITTTNVGSTTLYWTNAGTSIAADIGGLGSGTVSISNNSGTLSLAIANDSLTEGNENIIIQLRTESTNGPIVATSVEVIIVDTSTAPVNPTYQITSPAAISEGGAGSVFTVSTLGVSNGTTLYWYINNSTYYNLDTNNADFPTRFGPFTINSGTGTFTVVATADTLTEGNEYFTVSISLTNLGTALVTSDPVLISDTSRTAGPAYALNYLSYSNEASTYQFVLSTLNVNIGSTYYWDITHVTTSNTDFVTTSGTFPINAVSSGPWTGTGTFEISTIGDYTVEGLETYSVNIRSSLNGLNIISGNPIELALRDTIVTITPLSYLVNESTTLTVNVTGSNITNGTYYWAAVPQGNTSIADFSGSSSGAFSISNNIGTFSITTLADMLTEGAESFTVEVRYGSTIGPRLGSSEVITINDTSVALVTTYTLTPAQSSVNEGSSLYFVFNGSNVPWTTYYWSLSSPSDFSVSSGSFLYDNDPVNISITPTADSTTEGPETFTMSIRSGSITGPILITSNPVTINDTSLTPTPVITALSIETGNGSNYSDEGTSSNFTINTYAIANGTSMTWTIENYGAARSVDFSATSGPFTINNNTGTFSIGIVADNLTEVPVEGYYVIITGGGILSPYRSPLYGINDTSKTPIPEYNITISASTADFRVYEALQAAGWNGLSIVKSTITVNSNATLYAPSTSSYGFTAAYIPTGSTINLVNNGWIVGKGGAGGVGGSKYNTIAPGKGSDGGAALWTNSIINITNNGVIGGGGGGGGGGESIQFYRAPHTGGGGGGGGAGGNSVNGGGGAGAIGSPAIEGIGGTYQGGTGDNGERNSPGRGGFGMGRDAAGNINNGYYYAGNGGSGGNLGQPGSSGVNGYSYIGAGTGVGGPGAAGAAVVGNSYITWVTTGIINGAQT